MNTSLLVIVGLHSLHSFPGFFFSKLRLTKETSLFRNIFSFAWAMYFVIVFYLHDFTIINLCGLLLLSTMSLDIHIIYNQLIMSMLFLYPICLYMPIHQLYVLLSTYLISYRKVLLQLVRIQRLTMSHNIHVNEFCKICFIS